MAMATGFSLFLFCASRNETVMHIMVIVGVVGVLTAERFSFSSQVLLITRGSIFGSFFYIRRQFEGEL